MKRSWLAFALVILGLGAPAREPYAQPVLEQSAPPPVKNHAPHYQGTEPAYFRPAESDELRYGKQIRFEVLVSDVDDDRVLVRALELPAGARFDEEAREFVWTPGKAEIGEHELRLQISDGMVTSVKVLRLRIVDNRAPSLSGKNEQRINSGARFEMQVQASDPDGDTLTFTGLGMPAGMELSPEGRLRWQPSSEMLGSHRFRVRVSDGEQSDSVEIHLKVEEEWSSYLLPGLAYGAYLPRDKARFGSFHGVTVELVLRSWIRRNDNRGPSHGRFYINASLLRSTEDEVSIALLYGAGLALSVERNPKRRWLLPHYGVEVGGLIQDQIGNELQVTPYAGLHLWASKNVYINASAGYLMVPSQIEDLGGWRFVAGGNFTLW